SPSGSAREPCAASSRFRRPSGCSSLVMRDCGQVKGRAVRWSHAPSKHVGCCLHGVVGTASEPARAPPGREAGKSSSRSSGDCRAGSIRYPVPQTERCTPVAHLRARFTNACTWSGQSCSVAGSKSAPLGHTSVCTSASRRTWRKSVGSRSGPKSSPARTGSKSIVCAVIHANVAVRADDRQGLERLCRYVLRPPVAQDRLELTADGRVLVILKGEWSDGTTHLLFEPVELLEKLAALTPRPRINLVLYHGVLAPHARWRGRVVAHARAEAGASAQADAAAPDRVEGSPDPAPEARIGARREPANAAERPTPSGVSKPRHWTWARRGRRRGHGNPTQPLTGPDPWPGSGLRAELGRRRRRGTPGVGYRRPVGPGTSGG